jgi:hypothetical protein
MNHSHIVPCDNVALEGFVKVDHSPVSDVYLALSELSLECKPHEILGLKLSFWTTYAPYGAVYTTRQNTSPPKPFLFTTSGYLLQVLHSLLKELPNGTNLYLFGYQDRPTELPKGCPKPKKVDGLYPKLIAVVFKT